MARRRSYLSAFSPVMRLQDSNDRNSGNAMVRECENAKAVTRGVITDSYTESEKESCVVVRPRQGLRDLLEAAKRLEIREGETKKRKEEPLNLDLICENEHCAEKIPPLSHFTRKLIKGHTYLLCEDCSKAYDNKQYCDKCGQIYTDTAAKGAVVDGLDWVECELCGRWNHVYCGKEKRRKMEEDEHYFCRGCLAGKDKDKEADLDEDEGTGERRSGRKRKRRNVNCETSEYVYYSCKKGEAKVGE